MKGCQKRGAGQICSKMVHLCLLNEMMVDLQKKTLPRVCRVPLSFVFTFFGYMIALCRRIKLSGAKLVIPFSFFLFTYPMLWL